MSYLKRQKQGVTETRVPQSDLPQAKDKNGFKGKTLTNQLLKVTRGSSKAGKKSLPLITRRGSQLIKHLDVVVLSSRPAGRPDSGASSLQPGLCSLGS